MNLFFDLETKDYITRDRKPRELRMSIGIVMDEAKGLWIYDETQVVDLIRLLMDAECVVGFNTIYFDYGVLSRYPLGWCVRKIAKTIDIFKEVRDSTGIWPSLNSVAEETIQDQKQKGIDPVNLYRSGKLDRVIEYCKQDVAITKRIYICGRETGKIWFKDKADVRKSIDVSWS